MGSLINYCSNAPQNFAPGGNASGNSANIALQNQLIMAGKFQTYCSSLGL